MDKFTQISNTQVVKTEALPESEGKMSLFAFIMQLVRVEQEFDGCLTLIELNKSDPEKLEKIIAIVKEVLQRAQPQIEELLQADVSTTVWLDDV